MAVSARVKEILSWYQADNVGVRKNLFTLLQTGTLAGTGKLVILPVDQGFEHGPARSFAPNPPAYDPDYHFELALESGCNAYAAPYGQLAAAHGVEELGAVHFGKLLNLARAGRPLQLESVADDPASIDASFAGPSMHDFASFLLDRRERDERADRGRADFFLQFPLRRFQQAVA